MFDFVEFLLGAARLSLWHERTINFCKDLNLMIEKMLVSSMATEFVFEFHGQMIMLIIIYLLVLVMIFLDLWSGVRKARKRGEYRTSYGLRKTGEKIAKYFNVLMLMTVIDALQMFFIYYLNPQINVRIPIVPIFTFGLAVFYGIVECKSMYESSEAKDKAKYQNAAKLVKHVVSNPEAMSILNSVAQYLKDENKDTPDGEIQQ